MRQNQDNRDGTGGHSTHALISKAEAGRVLAISQRSIRRLVKAGLLEEVSLGPGMRPRLRLRDVLELADGKRGSP